jgi:excinuclease ABC subunit A
MSNESIVVRGARVHNLKNISFEIPHNQMTVVTGVSGSGKSSIAFDTIYAEGQRRYVESLSAYARQFLERIEKPDVDVIEGIAPAIAIKQKNTTRNPRSTVGTSTEIYDYLRLLFARVGTTFCLNCGAEVKKDSVDEVATTMLALPEGTRLHLLFPVKVAANGEAKQQEKPKRRLSLKSKKKEEPVAAISEPMKERLFDLRKRGFTRLYQNEQIFEFASPESLLDLNFAEPIYILVDRLVVGPEIRSRLVDGTEIAYRETGEVIFETVPREEGQPRERFRFSQRFECKNCHIKYQDPEPRLFSFNNPFGACPRCQGFGNTIDFDPDLVIPDQSLTLEQGAIDPWTKPKYRGYLAELRKVARQLGVPMNVPWRDLTDEQRDKVMDGDRNARWIGVKGFFDYLERKKYKLHVRVFLSRYRGYATCPECKGQRLRAEARNIKIAGRNICDITSFTVGQARQFFDELKLTREQSDIADRILLEIRNRLKFLDNVGLDYLSLDRLSSTLSGGEAQRIQLASSLASRLVGALYVLDEPSIGLHSRDTERLVNILKDLRDLGNTILVVEHDVDVMQASDRILDLGPGAGEHGGRVIGQGTLAQIAKTQGSLTGRYLSGELKIPVPQQRREKPAQQIKLYGARAHNLKKVDVQFPLGMLVAITGVSGSGKSTLIHEVLYKALANELGVMTSAPSGNLDKIEGAKYLNDVVLVDQSPIGRTPRSNPVTYIKAFDCIRDVFAATPEAQKRGYTSGYFSFNIPGGRCETCSGDGTVTVEMQFLADVELTCEECKGTRYKPSVLEVRFKGKNIHDVLNLTVKEALAFFAGVHKVTDKLRLLEEVGLGYLRLGQSATTLSGGEAQRMKLAAHLQPKREIADTPTTESDNGAKPKKRTNRTLYIFDEPTTGLHFDDVSKLLFAFRRLLDTGASIIVIEHNLDVIKTADWVIDLGPEGGDRGGEIVAVGPPEEIAKNKKSHTGRWLRGILSGNGYLPSAREKTSVRA